MSNTVPEHCTSDGTCCISKKLIVLLHTCLKSIHSYIPCFLIRLNTDQYVLAGYRARPGGQTCIANPTWTIWCLPSWTAMRNLCPWRTKAAFIDSYCYPPCEQSSWEGKDVYRLSRCSSGTQPSMCLSCYWEIGKLNQQCVNCLGTSDCESMHLFKFMTFKEHVVNPEPSSSFTVTKKKEIISQCILYIYTWHGFLEVHNPNVLSQPFFVWFSECSNFPLVCLEISLLKSGAFFSTAV